MGFPDGRKSLKNKANHDRPLTVRPDQRLFDQVCDRLRSAIVTGHFEPGTRMLERELTSWLGVSRTPIREALRRLEQEGLIVGYPHRGFFVRNPSFEEARQAYEMRRVVETACCGFAAERATEVDLAEMRVALRKAQSLLESGDRVELLLCNAEIHHAIARAAHNDFLEKEWVAMWAFADLLRGRWWGRTSRPETGHVEHVKMVEAIAEGNSTLARQLSEQHVRLAWTNVASRFEEEEEAGAKEK